MQVDVEKCLLFCICWVTLTTALQKVTSITEVTLEYETTDEYPTAMYFITSVSTGFIATDSPLGGARFYTFTIDGIASFEAGSDTSGYDEGSKPDSTYTHISSLSLRASHIVVAEESCIRFHHFAHGESLADRIGNCTVAGFQTESTLLLQDILHIHVTSENMMYVLCGNNGPGKGGLMSIDMADGNTALILAEHDDIALSADYPLGAASLQDMTIDSTGSTIYILVNNGGIVVYDVTGVTTANNLSPVYRISSENGDPGANYTHNNLISDNGSLVLSADGMFMMVQSYGSDDETDNDLISLDLSHIESLDNGPILRRSYSYLCAGGTESVEGDSSSCVTKADFERPLMALNKDGGLIMIIHNTPGISSYEYHLGDWVYTTTTAPTTTTTTAPTTTTTTTPTTTTTTTPTTTTMTTPTTTTMTTPSTSYTTTTTGIPSTTSVISTTNDILSTSSGANTSTKIQSTSTDNLTTMASSGTTSSVDLGTTATTKTITTTRSTSESFSSTRITSPSSSRSTNKLTITATSSTTNFDTTVAHISTSSSTSTSISTTINTDSTSNGQNSVHSTSAPTNTGGIVMTTRTPIADTSKGILDNSTISHRTSTGTPEKTTNVGSSSTKRILTASTKKPSANHTTVKSTEKSTQKLSSTKLSTTIEATVQMQTQTQIPTKYSCHECSSQEKCVDMPAGSTTLCTGACYSWSERSESGTPKLMKGCASDILSENLTEVVCDVDTQQGACLDYTVGEEKVEGCVRCCTEDECNVWMLHEDHWPSDDSSIATHLLPKVYIYVTILMGKYLIS